MAIPFLKTPFTDAANFLRSKAVVGLDTFRRLPPDLQARAISVVGVNSMRAVADMVETAASIPEGENWDTAKEMLVDQLRPHLSKKVAADLFSDPAEYEKTERLIERRAENFLRINVGQAYSAAKTQTLDDNDDIFPYREYLTMEDNRVRSSHAALNHLILPANHPFWLKHTPPWEFGCRCDFAGVSAGEAGEIKQAEQARGVPREQQSVLDDDLQEQVAEGRLMRGNSYVDLRTQREKNGDGYEWNPRSLKWPRARLMETFKDETVKNKWVEWAKSVLLPESGQSIWEWMA